jgi:plastocyanin
MPRIAPAILIATLALASGCKSNTPKAAPQSAQASTPETVHERPLDPATLGDVTGIVRLAGKPPGPVRMDTSMDPACAMEAAGDLYTEQYVVNGEHLANVYVYVKSGPAEAMSAHPTASAPVVLDQKGCIYIPHVIAVGVGQPVEFHNSDPTMHNIQTMAPNVVNLTANGQPPSNPRIDLSQGPNGKPKQARFPHPELMIPVRCNLHPWMNAFINISATPWFAVTGPDGKFELKGLPAGDYALGAVHEKLGEQEIKVTVKPKTSTQADVTFAFK